MQNHDDKYPSRPKFEPGTPRLQAPVDTNEPSGPTGHSFMDSEKDFAALEKGKKTYCYTQLIYYQVLMHDCYKQNPE